MKKIRNELCEESFSIQEQTKISQQFIETILHNEALAESLKDLTIWISMFKRLLVRLLLLKMNINFESYHFMIILNEAICGKEISLLKILEQSK
jgi:hypothetical protein